MDVSSRDRPTLTASVEEGCEIHKPDYHTTTTTIVQANTQARAGALITILPGWVITRVGLGQNPQYTRAHFGGEAVGCSPTPHVARRNPRPRRRQGGQPSSGIIYLHAQCLEGEESPRPRVARERACGGSARRSLWLGVLCAALLGTFVRSTCENVR